MSAARRRRPGAIFALPLVAIVGLSSCARHSVSRQEPPAASVGPFYVGVSFLDVGENERGAKVFDELTKSIPDEPAVWANLGTARLRLGDLSGAQEAFAAAAKIAPDSGRIAVLQATLDEYQGHFAEAISRLKALPDPDAAVLYRMEELLGRIGSGADAHEQLEILERIDKKLPHNLVVAFVRARILARMQDARRLSEAVDGFAARRAEWGPAAAHEFELAKSATAVGDFRGAATHLAFLQNLSLPTAEYQAGLAALGASGGAVGEAVRDFMAYASPPVEVAAADTALTYSLAPRAHETTDMSLALDMGAPAGPSIVTVGGGMIKVGESAPFSTQGPGGILDANSLCAADLNGDFQEDIALADSRGLHLWMQDETGRFKPFQPPEGLKQSFSAPAHGVWALDFDGDGDLDLVVARAGAAPQLLRNNGDGTLAALDTLSSFPEIRDLCWVDLDGDGNNDMALLGEDGKVLVSWNNRSGSFSVPTAISNEPAVALSFGDVEGAGRMELVALGRDGAVRAYAFDRAAHRWSGRELARWTGSIDLAGAFAGRRASLHVADLDNNGAADLIASAGDAAAIWLGEGGGRFKRLGGEPAMFVASVSDLGGDGVLGLVGTAGSAPAVARGHATKGYRWSSIRTRTLANRADGRINSFGIGGRIEIRAGPLVANELITAPRTHFGLGANPRIDAARIIWPNGVAQFEFDLEPGREVTAVQRLKGSCPWVFAKANGVLRFVKDFIWRSPLGMRINARETAGVDQTLDWILIPGRFLSDDKGAYEVRITAELWETHFFDHVSLKVVDHPDSYSVFVDERFVPTSRPNLGVVCTSQLRPFTEVVDESGLDVSRIARGSNDGYVDGFPLGRYQGVAKDHWLEFELPANAPMGRPLAIVGQGWIYPTDSSLNVAISQGSHESPRGLVLEALDPKLGWRTVSGDLGFPAGKNKTVVIPFPAEPLAAGARRFRLRTNLEIYWDKLEWAEVLSDARPRVSGVDTLAADLRYRGFSELSPTSRRRPDIPSYGKIAATGPRWRDLEGFYTRYGDVRELLSQVDDRYVIMNAGDEMVLRFAAPPPPPAGWTRDFVLVGDGWVKDGDFNTVSSRTVGPLPYHGMKVYSEKGSTLEDDPVFLRHLGDWRVYQTRYVDADAFERGLLVGAAGSSP